jgi:glucose-6-phosphate 1-dehydrogenase
MEETAGQQDSKLLYRLISGCEIRVPRPCSLVIFGVYGDLAKTKIIPSLYRLHKSKLLPENFFILGTGRRKMSDGQFIGMMQDAAKDAFPQDFDALSWSEFAAGLYYVSFDFDAVESYSNVLKQKLTSLEKKHRTGENRMFYLATPPAVFEPVIHNLGLGGLSREERGRTYIIIEKPFGNDLDSAKSLNSVLKQYFNEGQIFRIDHYIAKETVQNMLMFRFANSIFEPLWNSRYIDHVQITVSETLGVEDRAGYYEKAGVIRDMFQSHIFQILAMTAMEPPVAFEADRLRDEKIKVLYSIRPFPLDRLDEYVVIGQYGKGSVNGTQVAGYREELGVSPKSITPTFAAMKVLVENWRWHGVPFYLRCGKRLSSRRTSISIHFKPVPFMMFSQVMDEPIEPNVLVFRVQPDEGISLTFQTKKPGSVMCLNPASMEFSYQKGVFLDAYEWVLLDCMVGDQILFWKEEGVERSWALLTPVIDRLESTTEIDRFPSYEAGSSGPEEAALLIQRDSRSWRAL